MIGRENHNYTFDDYRYDMPARAMGSETEYTNDSDVEGAIYQNGYDGPHKKLLRFVRPEWFISPGRHMTPSAITKNGGELYLDFTVLEYSTPECTTPQELVLHERAGETIVYDTMMSIGMRNGKIPKVYKRSGYTEVIANNEPYPILNEMSIGHHESYSSINVFSNLPLSTHSNEMKKIPEARQLGDFLALRKLIDGVGMVGQDHFSITQKPRAINYRAFDREVGANGKRPFRQNTSRLEVRSGEGNKSDWAVAFKVGLTSLVLRLIEHGKYPQHLELYDPNVTVLKIAKDPMALVTLKSGINTKAIEVLKDIVDTAYAECEKYEDFPEYEKQAYADFVTFYNDLHQISLPDHDVSALSDRIDWAARYKFFIDYGATYETFTARNLEQVRYDLLWDRIGTKDIARKRFAKFGHTALCVDVPEPPRTRAAARVKIVKDLYDNDNLQSVDWNAVTTKDEYKYSLQYPLSQESEIRRLGLSG
ncbi:proteasome accessory factor PafA2 family protein [Candidatus Saccharibacteria bacterium]|nr:proteasome accessory factor PafA2 family protein [Candidatus Saccharibacteria bacterium]